jgi:hypothetical protein
MKTHDILERIKADLGGCSNKVICRYLGVKQANLIDHLEEDFDSTASSVVGQRLRALAFVLKIAKQCGVTGPGALHRTLNLPALEIKDGWKIGVIEGIQNDASSENLIKILKNALTVSCDKTSTSSEDDK